MISSVCGIVGVIVCSTVILLHTVQRLPSDKPVCVQVAGVPCMVSSVWGIVGVIFCSSVILLQTVQRLPSDKPVCVQVAGVPCMISSVCGKVSITVSAAAISSSISSSLKRKPHSLQRQCAIFPSTAQVGAAAGTNSATCSWVSLFSITPPEIQRARQITESM